jgi:hypothetical protein
VNILAPRCGPAALVREACLCLIDSSQVRWQNRMYFFGVSAQLIWPILVDYVLKAISMSRFRWLKR